DADGAVLARADIGGPRRRGFPHRAGEIEQRVVVGVLQVNAHVRNPAMPRRGWTAAKSTAGRRLWGGEMPLQSLVDQGRVSLSGHGFHGLADKESEQLVLARPEFRDLVGIGR